jgi:hypothetical protein
MNDVAQKMMSCITNNWSVMERSTNDQVRFVNFCIGRLKVLCKDSKQKIMLQTMLSGLESNPVYSRFYKQLCEEFSRTEK